MDLSNLWPAFGLTIFAGLSTGVGSALAFFGKQTNKTFLSLSLGFSAGVMIYVSLVEIFQKAQTSLRTAFSSDFTGSAVTVACFFGGMGVIALIDKLVPSYENPHEFPDDPKAVLSEEAMPSGKSHPLYRMGIFSALAIAIHNFPEGLATFMAALQDPIMGVSIAVAIAIHNIPEGIAVSVPIFYATGSRRKALWFSFLSGLAEPVGAAIGFIILLPFLNEFLFGIIFAAVAGIMVYISLDELLPSAEKYGHHHHALYGLIGGMAVMAVSLVMFL